MRIRHPQRNRLVRIPAQHRACSSRPVHAVTVRSQFPVWMTKPSALLCEDLPSMSASSCRDERKEKLTVRLESRLSTGRGGLLDSGSGAGP